MSAMPSSSATASGGAYSYRTAGGPPGPGLLLRGSTSRALHELVAVERERIGGLLQELANSAAVVEKQQAALVQLHSALQVRALRVWVATGACVVGRLLFAPTFG